MHTGVQVLLALAVMFFAAGVKGALGFGFPLIAVPVLSSLVGTREAVVAFTIPCLVSNLIIVRQGRRERMQPWVLWLMGGLAVGAVAGAELVTHVAPGVLALVVGLLSLAMVASGPFVGRLSAAAERVRRMAPLAGVAAGVLGGTTSIYSPVLAAYLQLLRIGRDRFAVLICTLFLLGGAFQIGTFAVSGLYGPFALEVGVLSCAPMFAGIWSGMRLRPRLQTRLFRVCVTVLVVASGLNLVREGIFGA